GAEDDLELSGQNRVDAGQGLELPARLGSLPHGPQRQGELEAGPAVLRRKVAGHRQGRGRVLVAPFGAERDSEVVTGEVGGGVLPGGRPEIVDGRLDPPRPEL